MFKGDPLLQSQVFVWSYFIFVNFQHQLPAHFHIITKWSERRILWRHTTYSIFYIKYITSIVPKDQKFDSINTIPKYGTGPLEIQNKTQDRTRGGSRRNSEGFDLIISPYLHYVFGQTGLRKQCRPRSDAAECVVWSEFTRFATNQAILHTFTSGKFGLLKRIIKKSVKFWDKGVSTEPRDPTLNPPLKTDYNRLGMYAVCCNL